MALEVASMLDEFIVKPEWLDKTTAALNDGLSSIKVSPGYNVMVTIAGRSYVAASDSKGKLSVKPVPNHPTHIAKAMAQANCRASMADAALKTEGDDPVGKDDFNWSKKMATTRKTEFSGNIGSFSQLVKELEPHMSSLRRQVGDAGPGAAEVQKAIEKYNLALGAGDGLEVQEDTLPPRFEFMELATPENGDNVMLLRCGSWLLFSAATGWFGNVGQGNYCAVNMQLDANTFSYRTQMASTFFEAITMMWGAVTGLGMRWKAFASQDFMADDPMSVSPEEAQNGVKSILMPDNPPEWTTMARNGYDQMTGINLMAMNPDPWGFGKGKGGGLTLHSDAIVSFHNVELAGKRHLEKDSDEQSWLYAGRRIRIQGLSLHQEMNGMKGTLVEEVSSGTWHVQMDDGTGDKLVQSKHMVQIQSSAAPMEAEVKTAPTQAQEQICLAGTWDAWTPANMQYDQQKQCHTFEVNLNGSCETQFAINRGQAGTRKWKPGTLKKWNMGKVNGRYKIKVFVADSKIGNVEWESVGA